MQKVAGLLSVIAVLARPLSPAVVFTAATLFQPNAWASQSTADTSQSTADTSQSTADTSQASAQTSPDPLLSKMAGTWIGEGERTQLQSGHTVSITSRTVATEQDDRLLSHNEITETDPLTHKSKSYVRDYWIRATPAQATPVQAPPGRTVTYDLGVQDKVTSQGHFDGTLLNVEQSFGGTPAYIIRSQTRFDDSGSIYEETAWSGDHQLSRTRIQYRH